MATKFNVRVSPRDIELHDWVLKQRVSDMGATFRAVWDLYIKFYTVFLTFSIGALALLNEHPHSHRVIAMVFMLQSGLCAGTSVAIGIYSQAAAHQVHSAESTLLVDEPLPKSARFISAIPVGLAMWCGFANALAMMGMVGVWYYTGFRV
jgi:hypothetical protein